MTGPSPAEIPNAPGTMDLRDRHYLVFAPGTPPLGRPSDTLVSAMLDAFAREQTDWIDLILRVADPEWLNDHPEEELWLRVRAFPGRHAIRSDGTELSFSGVARQRTAHGDVYGPKLACSCSIDTIDHVAGARIGEVTLSQEATQ